jgi:hypothetical protein
MLSSVSSRGKRGRKHRKLARDIIYDEEEETGDILTPYYDSRLPAEEESLSVDRSGSASALSDETKKVATLRADELIDAAAKLLETDDRTQHLMLRNPDILWLNAGGNPETIFRSKLREYGAIAQLKMFPRHCFACVSFEDARSASKAQFALHQHTVYCNAMKVTFLKRFLSREVILASQEGCAAPGRPEASSDSPPCTDPRALLQSTEQRKDAKDDHAHEVEEYMTFLLGD